MSEHAPKRSKNAEEITPHEASSSSSSSTSRKSSGASTAFPLDVIEQMKDAGAEYKKIVGEDLVVIGVTLGDKAHDIYKKHCLPNEYEDGDLLDDPLVNFTLPTPDMGVIPHIQDMGGIILEASAIINAYAPLLAPSFAPNAPQPVVGPPLGGLPVGGVSYHHASVTAHAFVQRISDGTGPMSPTIARQPRGTILGHVSLIYSNAVVGIIVPKS